MKQLSWPYYGGILVAADSRYQQKLIFHRQKVQCFKAFLNNNWFGMVVFTGLVVDYLIR